MAIEKSTICINNKNTMHIEVGHTYNEWEDTQDTNECWSFTLEDMLTGAIEPDKDLVYWLINNRLYETNILILA